MRSKDTAAQYERAFSLLEKQLEASQANLQSVLESKFAERDWFIEQLDRVNRSLEQKVMDTHLAAQAQFKKLAEMIDRSHTLSDIPQGDTPTMEEMIELAKSDPTTRKRIENTLRELEFEDPLVGFN